MIPMLKETTEKNSQFQDKDTGYATVCKNRGYFGLLHDEMFQSVINSISLQWSIVCNIVIFKSVLYNHYKHF